MDTWCLHNAYYSWVLLPYLTKVSKVCLSGQWASGSRCGHYGTPGRKSPAMATGVAGVAGVASRPGPTSLLVYTIQQSSVRVT